MAGKHESCCVVVPIEFKTRDSRGKPKLSHGGIGAEDKPAGLWLFKRDVEDATFDLNIDVVVLRKLAKRALKFGYRALSMRLKLRITDPFIHWVIIDAFIFHFPFLICQWFTHTA